MEISTSKVTHCRLLALTCVAMIMLSLIPQFHLWLVRGKDWNGAYVGSYGDELLYAGYANALIEGRARKNDPFGAKDDSASTPLPESFFSIQFLPAYAIALPARAFGITASSAFIILIGLAACFSALSVFWLLEYISADYRLATAGTLFVLCLGCIVGRYSLFGTFLDFGFPALPFLRRYQPAVAFPLFFIFQLLILRALASETQRRAWTWAMAAGLTLATLVFSYLYLWTAGAAWLACIGVPWIYFRSSRRRQTMMVLITVGAITALALIPYVYLLSHRAMSGDGPLILFSTHTPDLLRPHEILGAVILAALVIGVRRNIFELTDLRVIYAASLALLPFIVFNQQVLSGRTMQAFHFENFIVNYSTLVGLLALIPLFWNPVPRRLLICMAVLSFIWGLLVVALPSRLLFVPWAVSNDLKIPVLRRLKELSNQDGTLSDLRAKGQASSLVFSPSIPLIALLPTWTSQGTLLDVTGAYCDSRTREETKEFFYMHLYYSNVHSEALRKALKDVPEKSSEELANVGTMIFGHERVFPHLSPQFEPVQEHEIEQEVQAFEVYASSFSREQVLRRPITYAIVPANFNFDFSNVDRWYDRDAGEQIGDYTLYRLKLRN